MMNAEALQARLSKLGIQEVGFYDLVGSTNDLALKWVDAGANDLTLVVADSQSAGRGREGRHWITMPGAALAFSIIVQPRPTEMDHLPLFSPIAGLAVVDAFEEMYGLKSEIKWPNDVLIDRRKTVGILVESCWTGGALKGLVIGIGVNVAPESVPQAADLRFPATSIEDVLGHPTDRWDLLEAILCNLLKWRTRIGSTGMIQAWEEHLAFRNEWVQIIRPGGEILTGKVEGISQQGQLRLVSEKGQSFEIAAGDVSLRPA